MIAPEQYIAATRFGLGMSATEAALSPAAVKDWLWGQVQKPEDAGSDFSGLASTTDNMRKFMSARSISKEKRKEAKREFKGDLILQMSAGLMHAIHTPTPFHERLVHFWCNHFTVSIKKKTVSGVAASYEREAIRPYVTGNFFDMLLAVAKHPAMLIYLDNANSTGPNSQVGTRAGKGLNENLAREIMELHTLGVNGGYTQADVTTFAKVITGWGIGRQGEAAYGNFSFAAKRHEPGAQTILGKTYAAGGEEQGIAVLRGLAGHPSTAQHLATKLARHFIADEPPKAAVDRLAAAYMQSGGDLKAMYQALLESPEAWSLTTPKIKSSQDYLISAARLCRPQANLNGQWYLRALKFLGDVPYTASSPAGFSDIARDVAGPEAILRRIEWAQSAAGDLAGTPSYKELSEMALAPVLSDRTRQTLAQASSNRQGLALLLGSPEFQRR